MAYSYVTHSKQSAYYTIVFENVMEPGNTLIIRFIPNISTVFSKSNIDLQGIRMRDPEVILQQFEDYGLTLVTHYPT